MSMTSCRRPGFGYTRATTIFVLSAMMCPFLKVTLPDRRAMVFFALLLAPAGQFRRSPAAVATSADGERVGCGCRWERAWIGLSCGPCELDQCGVGELRAFLLDPMPGVGHQLEATQ